MNIKTIEILNKLRIANRTMGDIANDEEEILTVGSNVKASEIFVFIQSPTEIYKLRFSSITFRFLGEERQGDRI